MAASLFSPNGKDIAQKLTIVLRTQLIKPIASLDKMEQSVEICKIDCIFCHIKYVWANTEELETRRDISDLDVYVRDRQPVFLLWCQGDLTWPYKRRVPTERCVALEGISHKSPYRFASNLSSIEDCRVKLRKTTTDDLKRTNGKRVIATPWCKTENRVEYGWWIRRWTRSQAGDKINGWSGAAPGGDKLS